MNESGALAAIACGVLVVGAGLVGVWSRGEPLRALPRVLAIGRTAAEQAVGPDSTFRGVLDRRAVPTVPRPLERLHRTLQTTGWPKFARRVVFGEEIATFHPGRPFDPGQR